MFTREDVVQLIADLFPTRRYTLIELQLVAGRLLGRNTTVDLRALVNEARAKAASTSAHVAATTKN